MCDFLLPPLYINMAGEMMYILEQRLRSKNENIEERAKSDKVLKEIVLAVLSKSTLDEIFRSRGVPTKKSLKMLYEKLAHSSIMRLNDNSMDKLFDLITMASKFHLQQIVAPEQIMTVMVNHLQGLHDIHPNDPDIHSAVDHAFTMVFTVYRNLNAYSWYMIKCGLLVFFQEARVKISMLLRENRQLSNGDFVLLPDDVPVQLPIDGEPVGVTRYFENDAVSHSSEFPPEFKNGFKEYETYPDALNVPQRSTSLGTNMYKNVDSLRIHGGGTSKIEPFHAGNEMAFMENIMSASVTNTEEGILGMSLFDDDNEEKLYVKESEEMVGKILRIDASSHKKSVKSEIEEKIGGRPATGEKKKKTKGANMLDLLDEAAARPPTAKPRARRSESTSGGEKPKSRAGRASSAAPKRAQSAKRKN